MKEGVRGLTQCTLLLISHVWQTGLATARGNFAANTSSGITVENDTRS